jgi:hypothetical protein
MKHVTDTTFAITTTGAVSTRGGPAPADRADTPPQSVAA